MRPESAKLLWDARDAAQRIDRFVGTSTLDEYLANDLLRSAVERQFEIIGEALGRLRRSDPTLAHQIPDLRRVVDFRNVLIHGYSTVDDRLVWEIVQTRSVTARKDSDHTPHRIPKHISRSETCGTRRSNVGNEMPVTEASFSGNGN